MATGKSTALGQVPLEYFAAIAVVRFGRCLPNFSTASSQGGILEC